MARLGDVCVINPKAPPIEDTLFVSFVPMPKVGEEGEFDPSETRPYAEVKKGFTYFAEGDVLFAKITPCMENGKGAVAHNLENGIGYGSTEFHVLRPKFELVLGEWLYYLTTWSAFRKEAERNMTGSAGQKRVPKDFLENYRLTVPSIHEQQQHVQTLNMLCTLIALRKQQIAKLDELVKARFVEMFGDPRSNPLNLPMLSLSELGEWNSGGTPVRSNADYFTGDIDWYSAGELNTLYLNGSIERITEEAIQNSAAKLFPAGSMLVGMYDTAAFKMGILRTASASNQACACIEPNDSINIVWLYYCLHLMKDYFLEQRRGVRQKNLNLGMIRSFQIPCAPKIHQDRFAAFVAQTDKQKLTIQQSLDKLELMKKALMQKYFG